MRAAALVTCLASLVFLPATAAAKDKAVKPAKRLTAIWLLSERLCDDSEAEGMERHPDEAAIQRSKVINLDELGLRFTVPQIGKVKNTVVKLQLGDETRRGVTDHYLLLSDGDDKVPFAAVLITELPRHLKVREEIFKAVNMTETRLAEPAGFKPTFERIDGPWGVTLELLVPDRVGTTCFPKAPYRLQPAGPKSSTYGISRFSLVNGHLVEFALIASVPSRQSGPKAVDFVREAMDRFSAGLSVIE